MAKIVHTAAVFVFSLKKAAFDAKGAFLRIGKVELDDIASESISFQMFRVLKHLSYMHHIS